MMLFKIWVFLDIFGGSMLRRSEGGVVSMKMSKVSSGGSKVVKVEVISGGDTKGLVV